MVKFGFINTIWDQSIGGIVRRHVLVTPLETLDADDRQKNPFSGWPGLACDIVYNTFEEDEVISPVDIITHAAFRVRPVNTFGIGKGIVVFHKLDRGSVLPLYS
jgi:hypothetical protein